MTIKVARLLSGRVPIITAGNVSADRYQFLSLGEAEPNLGTSALGNVLTTDTSGSRIWTNSLSISSITLTANLTAGNIVAGGFYFANGAPFTSSTFGNTQVDAYLKNYNGQLGNTVVSTNFSTGNAVITGGHADYFQIGGSAPASGAFTTLAASDIVQFTSSLHTTGLGTGAFQVTHGGASIAEDVYIGGNLYVLGNSITVNKEYVNTTEYANTIVATTITAGTIGNVGANLIGTGTYITGVSADSANISLYQNLSSTTANKTFFLTFYDKTAGNAAAYTNNSLTYNSSNGTLSASTFSGAGTLTTLTTSGTAIIGGNAVMNSGAASSSTTTGALVIPGTGGAGIGGSLYVGGLLNIANTGDVSANIGTVATSLQSLTANVGAFETYANANIGSITTSLQTLTANVGAFETYANANAATQATAINSLYTNANANTAAYLTTATGNITAGNIVATGNITATYLVGTFNSTGTGGSVTGANLVSASYVTATANVTTANIISTNYLYPNGASILSGIGGTYSNANVAAYLASSSTTGNIYAGNIVATGNITATYLVGTFNSTGTGGSVTGANLISANNFTFSGNGVSIITAAPGTYSNANVTAYLPTDSTISGIQANIGAFEIYANANIGTIATSLQSLTANVGAYETYANANAAAQAVSINSLATNANANTAAYLTTATGNIQAGNLTVLGNLTVANIIYTNTEIVTSNEFATGNITATNIIANTNAYAGNVLATGNVTAQYFVGSFAGTGTGGNISGANVISANTFVGANFNFANGVNILSTISAGSTYSNTNVAAYLSSNTVSNIYTTGNIVSSGNISAVGNVTAQYFVGSFAGTGTGGNISGANVISANTFITSTGIFWANGSSALYGNTQAAAYLPTDPTITGIQANLGSYENTTNANIGSIFTRHNQLDANVGAFEIYANANIGTITTSLQTLNANVGAYETYANANASTLATAITSLATGANANTAAYLASNSISSNINVTGNIVTTANVTAANFIGNLYGAGTGGQITGANLLSAGYLTATVNLNVSANAYIGNVLTNNYLFANGVNILSTITVPSTYSNTNVAAYLSSNNVSNISTTGNITSSGNIIAAGNVTAQNFIGNLYGVGTGGQITGANLLSASYLAATTNLTAGAAYLAGGYADNLQIGANTAASGKFTSLSASGITTLTNTTNNSGTTYTSGALQISGGVGIAQDLYVQGNIYAGNLLSTTTQTLEVTDPLLYLAASNPGTYNYEIGFYSHFVGGPLNTYQHTGLTRNHNDNVWYFFSNLGEPSGGTINLASVNIIYDAIKAGNLVLANTQAAISTTTGVLQVAGGAGVQGSLYVGGILNLPNAGDVSANIGTLSTSVQTLNANIGAFEIYANANAASQQTAINSLYTNANANTAAYLSSGSIASNITTTGNITTTANIQAAYVIGNFVGSGTGGSLTGANLVSASYVTAGANVQTANLTVTANAYIGNVLATQYLYANGVSILTGIGGTYSNTNVAAYLSSNTVSNISTTGNITSAGNITASGNVYGSYLVGNFLGSGTGGQITGANLISASYLTATANVTTANITATNYLYPNGASILSGIGGTYSNTNVAGYLAGNITTGNITNTGIITATGNVTAAYFVGAFAGTGTGGTITGGNLISANYVTATSNVTTANIISTNYLYPNGQSILTGIGGTYSNANVAGYLAGNITTGNITNTGAIASTGNITAPYFVGAFSGTGTGGTITGGNLISANYVTATSTLTAGNISTTNGVFWANGVSALGSYGNTQVAAYLSSNTITGNITTTGNISTTSNITAGNIVAASNVTAAYFVGSFASTGSGGSISGANLISASYLTATANVTTANIISTNYLYPNGASILSGIGGTYSNTNVAGYLAGNITTGNITNTGAIASTGNVIAPYFVGSFASTGTGGSISGANLISASYLAATTNLTAANISTTNGLFWANGVSALGSYGNTQVAAYLNSSSVPTLGTSTSNTTVAGNLVIGGNLFVQGNLTYVNTEVINTTEYVATVNATSINAATIGNVGATGVFGNISAGNINVTSNVYATSFIGNLYGTATGGSITNANLISGTYLTATANVTTSNLIVSNSIIWSNGSAWSSGGGASGSTFGNANLATLGSNVVTTTGNVNAGNINVTSNVYATSFIGNLYGTATGGSITNANLISGTYLTATSNVTTANIIATNYLYPNGQSILTGIGGTSSYGNSNVAAFLSNIGSNSITTISNISAGNITTTGIITATGNVTAPNFIGNLYGAGSGGFITNANLLSAVYLTATANVTTANLIVSNSIIWSNGSAWSSGGGGGTSNFGNANLATLGSNVVTTTGNVNAGNINVTSNVYAGNTFVTGNVTATNFIGNLYGVSGTGGYITGANLLSATYVTATTMTVLGNATAGNVIASGFYFANGAPFVSGGSGSTYGNTQVAVYLSSNTVSNIYTTGNIVSSGNITATGNVSGTYLIGTLVGAISATGTGGNISGANVISANSFVTANGVFWANGSSALFTPVGYTGTLPYANVANYTVSTPTSSGSTYYPQLASSTGGNVVTYGSSALSFVPSTGTLTATTFSGSGSLSTLNVSSTSTLSGVVTLNSGIATNDNNTGALVITGSGGLAVAGNVNLGNQLFVGSGAQATVLTSPVQISRGTSTSGAGTQYTQTALINATNTGSSDFIAYGDNYPGTSSDHGWMDVGYTGSTFNDPAFTITGANDGYVFAGAVSNSLGGNLVLATDYTGSYRDVVVAVGSFYSNAEVARFHGNATTSGYFALKQGTAATSTTTGALRVAGGAGITGNVFAGNVLASGFFYANGSPFSSGATGAVSYAQATAPTSPNVGDFWYKTTTDILYRYTYDGTTTYWLDIISAPSAFGNLSANSNVASTSTTTGAFQVTGGAGITGNVFAGSLYTTNGLFWANGTAFSSGGGTSTIYTTSATAPSGPAVGDQWYDTSTSTLFRYTYDGTSSFWLDISGASNPVPVSTSAATPPSNPNVGDFWYNTTTDVLSRYTNDGTTSFWLDLSGSPLTTTLTTDEPLHPFLLMGA